MSARGYVGVHLPAFRLDRCGWAPDVAVVLVSHERGADRVQACSAPAARAGVAPGMTLAAARALLPEVLSDRLDPEGEQEDLRALAAALVSFTPAVRVTPPAGLVLDVGRAVLPALRRTLLGLGHAARLVHAPDAEVARILAAHLPRDRALTEAEMAPALAPLPVGVLGLDPDVVATLADVGVRTAGQLARLPTSALTSRWGPSLAVAHARASGRALSATPVPTLVDAREDSTFHIDFPDPVDATEAILFVLAGLVRDLCRALERVGRAAVRVQLRLRLEEGEHVLPVRLGRPMRGPDRIFRVLRLRLERVSVTSPVTALTLELAEAAVFRAAQPGLLERAEAAEPLGELCARLQDTLGTDAVFVPVRADRWRPEVAWTPLPVGQSPPPPRRTTGTPRHALDPAGPHEPDAEVRARPPTLLPDPRAIRVAAAPSGRPRAVYLDDQPEHRGWLQLDPVDGPERLHGEWWTNSTWKRDYWRVGLPDGRRAWIYREALPGDGDRDIPSQRWWLHGWIDGACGAPEPPPRARAARRAPPAYAELVARSNYSFCEGASFPEELVDAAEAAGLRAVALTDRDGVYGSVRFHKAAKGKRLQAIQGALLTVRAGEERLDDGGVAASVAALVMNATGWSSLCRLVTHARAEAEKGRGELPIARLLEGSDGLILLARGAWSAVSLAALRDAAPDRVYRAVSRRLAPGEEARITSILDEAAAVGVPGVATNDVLLHDRDRAALQDVLTCIRVGTTLDAAGRRLQPNAERVLKDPARMAALFGPWPALVPRTLDIASQCTFSMDELRYTYPREVVPEGYSAIAWLRELCRRGLHQRYGPRAPVQVSRQVEYELAIVERLDFAAYFLTVHDLVLFARKRGILCQGRGSAANSAVCYVLGVTAVDPACTTLLFERFISEERGEPPDIDIDFEHERREEVIQYVYEKYGRHRAAMVNEVICWRGRMAVRDVGKAVGFDADQVDRLASALDHWGSKPPDEARIREAGLDPSDPALELTRRIVGQIQGFPRHTSIHVGGFVIADGALIDRAPVEPATMEGRTVVQWDKNDIDDLGFVKVDLLSLGMLTAIRKCFDLMRSAHCVHHDLATVPREDASVYDLLCEADSIGVFQVESRAQQGMLPRLRPRTFYDLVIETAIVRPGPIQGGMVHPYLRRRAGEEEVTYVDPRLRPILERTLGVPIFQEQVMAMAVAVGGFTAGEADQLRRAMGAWRRKGSLGAIGEKLMRGMLENGLPPEFAEQVFRQIQGFAEYGFPESHAASFAHLVYVSAWQRCHFPAAFCAALINAQPMGFYAPRTLVADAQRHGVEVREVDVGRSAWDCTLEPGEDGPALRLGFRLIRGFREDDAHAIVAARGAAPYHDCADLFTRSGVGKPALRLLARAGALAPIVAGGPRDAVWAVEGLREGLFAGLARVSDEAADALPRASEGEALQGEYTATGLSVHRHPVGLVRPRLERQGVTRLSRLIELPPDTEVTVAGLVSHRQRPGTASGVVFLSLEDETGSVNVVVWPKLYERQRTIVRNEPLVTIRGVLQREAGAMSVVARHFRALDTTPVRVSSRDFR